MSARAPKAKAALEEAFRNHPMVQLLGIRLKSVTRKRVSAELPVTPAHMNRGGRVAGGIIMTLADVLGARGTVANLPPGARTTTIESKTNFFAAGTGPVLHATSVPLHIGRSTMVWQTTVRNPDRRLVAVVTQTQIVLLPAPPALQANGTGAKPATPVQGARTAARRQASSGARAAARVRTAPRGAGA